MCGIAGIWTAELGVDDTVRRVTAMTHQVRHRGPDDFGVDRVSASESRTGDRDAIVVFGHRRLSIIDLSVAGHQPMKDSAFDNWITYNGEIYNFLELRQELGRRGHAFVSMCDTEVILKAYAEWGVGCWRRLRGIFSFALWDGAYKELHLVRDHLGVKPLYFSATPKALVFASEVRAILAGGLTERRLSMEGLESFLKYGSLQEPCTMVMGIESLLPGHYMTCEESGRRTVRHYWQVEECLVRNWPRRPSAAEVRERLEDSVQRQLISDVPVGIFLSGGIDSTAVAALASRKQPGNIRTFCIGSDEPEFDESGEAARTAAHLGCRHTTLVLEGKLVREQFMAALRCYDQPSADGINTYFISMLVRQAGIKVALSGLGGDELFIGYGGFGKGLMIERLGGVLRWLPADLKRILAHVCGAISPVGNAAFGAFGEMFEPEQAAPYFASRTHFSRWHSGCLASALRTPVPTVNEWRRRELALARVLKELAAVDRVSCFELQTYMLSTLLRDSDQMSMAHGLELRVPLIDPEVVEHVLPIGTAEKTAGGLSKRLIIDALASIVPPDVAGRRKRGFTLPFRQWLNRDLEETAGACFRSESLRGPWDRAVFRRVWTDFKRGRVAWSRVLALFVLENWLRENGISA